MTKRGRAIKRAWADPAKRSRWVKSLRRANSNPEVRRRKSEAQQRRTGELAEQTRQSWTDPKIRARRMIGIKRGLRDPDLRPRLNKLRSEASLRRWANPEKRRQILAAMQASEKYKGGRSAVMKSVWARPGYRRKTVAAQRRAAATPEARQRKSVATKRLWEKRNAILQAAASGQFRNGARGGRPRNDNERAEVERLRAEGKSWGQIQRHMNAKTGKSRTAGAYRYLIQGC